MNAGEVKLDEQSRPDASELAAQKPIASEEDIASATASLSDTGRVDSEREALEIGKLSLEIKALAFKQSRRGRLIELLQGAAPVLAILSLVWTVFVGLNQQAEQRKDAESARFERAYTKLGSRLPSERATGVAQASSLLRLAGGARVKDIVTALANQLALDEDAAVGSAIQCPVESRQGNEPGRTRCRAQEHRRLAPSHGAVQRYHALRTGDRATGSPRHLLRSA